MNKIMKSIQLNSILYAVVSLLIFSLVITSCQKQAIDSEILPSEEEVQLTEKFQKIITVQDRTGDNVVEIQLSADNANALESFDEKSLSITTITANEVPQTDIDGEVTSTAITDQFDTPVVEEVEKSSNEVHFTVLDTKLASGVVGFKLSVTEKNDRYSGARWFHNRKYCGGIVVNDPYGCSNVRVYKRYSSYGTPYYRFARTICSGRSTGAKYCPYYTSVYVSYGYNYNVWFY